MKHTGSPYRSEWVGALVMVCLGSAMHFAFESLGGWRPAALFAAVNESIWEHLKLAFWPGLLWGLVMPVPANRSRPEVLATKGLCLLVVAIVIVAVFTSYTAILGRNLLALDIGTFVGAICIGQALSAWLLARRGAGRSLVLWAGSVLLALQIIAYSLFTYFPPDHWLFVETRSGQRGIVDGL